MNIKKCKYVNKLDAEGKKIPDFAITVLTTVVENDKDVIWTVPMVEGNCTYDEIMRQVDAGELTIEPADE